ncbi:hypothetical protein GP486_004868 [Trichoglossum hirsutum]|uniref:Alpha/beta hydrolase fold-3 domain-containing protein n=1 Tax=Trichoglossum hirsutum TaxID=265104 RepID=A0A9P8LAC7_9PEZI|nr:hypothetical protein GP486_004868 [Trichoglossum hirsutum]
MAPTSTKPHLGIGQKLVLVLKLIKFLSSTVLSLLSAPFRGSAGAPQYIKHVGYHAIRSATGALSSEQIQYLIPSTDESYAAFAKWKGFIPQSIVLADGTKGHWIGPKDAEKKPISASATASRTLSQPFGYRLGQEAFECMCRTFPPAKHSVLTVKSKIVLAGDSAGGNLCLALLSHMSHPHPDVPKVESTENFRGAALLSPWVTFDIGAPAMKTNRYKDCLKDKTLQYWGDQFMGKAKADPYNQPLTASSDWWSALAVDEILIVAGADEIMIDDIQEFAKKLEVNNNHYFYGFTPNRELDL